MTDTDLKDKIVLITGGANGIGRAAAEAFLAEGSKVAIVDISEGDLAATAGDLDVGTERLITIPADVSRESDVASYVRRTVDVFGTIDVFINNAGIEGNVGALVDQSVADFDRLLAVNVRGSFLGLKYVLPVMYEKGSGAIVNTSSVGGLAAIGTGASPYATTKFAVAGLTRLAAREAAAYGVRVNSVHPGMTDTGMNRRLEKGHAAASSKNSPDAGTNNAGMSIPLERWADPAEIAQGMVFLASAGASYVAGSQLVIDGGLLA